MNEMRRCRVRFDSVRLVAPGERVQLHSSIDRLWDPTHFVRDHECFELRWWEGGGRKSSFLSDGRVASGVRICALDGQMIEIVNRADTPERFGGWFYGHCLVLDYETNPQNNPRETGYNYEILPELPGRKQE